MDRIFIDPYLLLQMFSQFLSIMNNEKKIMLTFDDGPDSQYTEVLLDLLAENDVKVTFLVHQSRLDGDRPPGPGASATSGAAGPSEQLLMLLIVMQAQ